MFVYGRHPVFHLLKAGRRGVRALFLLSGHEVDPELAECCRAGRVKIESREKGFFAQRLGADTVHQGILAETSDYPYVDISEILSLPAVLALDGIEDPQNLGAIARSAHLMGVSGILLPQHRSAEVTPAVCRASAGAVEYLKIARGNLAQGLEKLKGDGFWVYGADPNGEIPLNHEEFAQKSVIVLGGEGKGLSRLVRERSDRLLKIPMVDPGFGSFNASVAAALVMYEWSRQKMCQNKRF